MKHQYESEILFRLMERDGFNIPSSVPPYESEIKAYLIEQVKLAYPKLTDYEAEWLLYNYTKHIPAEFPIETFTNVTNASINNVVPYAYKSAILKGNTLVNLVDSKGIINQSKQYKIVKNVVANKKYIAIFPYLENTEYGVFNGGGAIVHYTTTNRIVFTTPSTINEIRLYVSSKDTTVELPSNATDIVCVEYQEDMENWDIPYFEGMQSVKLPALTTTGKNLLNESSFTYKTNSAYWGDSGELQYAPNRTAFDDYVSVEPNTQYVLSGDYTSVQYAGFNIIFYDSDKSFISKTGGYSAVRKFTTPSNAKYLRFSFESFNLGKFQLEKGTQATAYEPFKSNILSCNEEVILRGIGDVKDTLDLTTGELTQRIGEIVLDGSEDWVFGRDTTHATNGRVLGFKIQIQNLYTEKWNAVKADTIVCDKLKVTSQFNQFTGEVYNSISQCSPTEIQIMIKAINDSLNDTLNELKRMLSENPVTVIYPVNDVIKTVDLSVVDENGNEINHFMPIEGTMHIQTDGEPIKPSVTMEIPVEATTQNLASFIEMGV